MNRFVIKTPAGKTIASGFEKKTLAKAERNRLTQAGEACVISRGPDHWRGETQPTLNCLSKERTSKRKHRGTPVPTN